MGSGQFRENYFFFFFFFLGGGGGGRGAEGLAQYGTHNQMAATYL